MSSSAEEEATISLPSLAFVAVLGYFLYRYFVSSRNDSGSANGVSGAAGRNGMRFTHAQVDQVAQMFPQLSRRDIMWDLHRNRGSVQATTERVLAGRGLDSAPPSFQPPMPQTTTTTTPSTSMSMGVTKPPKQEIDLITRYNLQAKVNSKGKEREDTSPSTGWASSKDARQQMLQKRRDEMILAARRRMMEADAGASTDAGTAAPAPNVPF